MYFYHAIPFIKIRFKDFSEVIITMLKDLKVNLYLLIMNYSYHLVESDYFNKIYSKNFKQ